MEEVFEVEPRDNRQGTIERMDIGESVAVARRIDTAYGIPENSVDTQLRTLRGTLDQQARRARRKFREKEFTVEAGTYLTRSGAIMISVVCTRIA